MQCIWTEYVLGLETVFHLQILIGCIEKANIKHINIKNVLESVYKYGHVKYWVKYITSSILLYAYWYSMIKENLKFAEKIFSENSD